MLKNLAKITTKYAISRRIVQQENLMQIQYA